MLLYIWCIIHFFKCVFYRHRKNRSNK